MKYFLSILLVTSQSLSFAATQSDFEWKFKQAGCKVASEAVAGDALKLSELHLLIRKIAEGTKPNSKEREEGVRIYSDAMDGVIERWKKHVRESRQGTNMNEVALALFFEVSAVAAVSLSMKHPGKDLEWYQDRIFNDCVRD